MKPYYQDDAVTLYNGDCREILPTLGRFDLLLTDPPYGIGFAAQPTKWQRKAGIRPTDWDNSTPSKSVFDQLAIATDCQFIWGGNYFPLPIARCWLVWTKPDSPPSMGSVEMCWTSLDRPARHMSLSISKTNQERVGHPTQKPVSLIRWCLSFAPDAETILDPFAGSGTTGLAAKLEGRKATLIELDERYCEIAAKRLEQQVFEFEGE
jgi:DNA modification methylase